jgi:hypothetical protein
VVPMHDIGILIALAVAQALWLIGRRVKTFAEFQSDLSLGALGVVIVPMRVMARVVSWIGALWVLALFIVVVPEGYFNGAIAALFIGFVIAYGVNLRISRYEQIFYPKRRSELSGSTS